MAQRFRLTSGVQEKDIQREILLTLGEEQFVTKKDKNGKPRKHSKNLYLGANSMFWRANSGWLRGAVGLVQVNSPGCADVLGVVAGRPIALECKTEEGRQNADQKAWQAIFESAGGLYALVRSVGEAVRFVASVKVAA